MLGEPASIGPDGPVLRAASGYERTFVLVERVPLDVRVLDPGDAWNPIGTPARAAWDAVLAVTRDPHRR